MSPTRVGIVGAGPMGRLHARTVARRAASDRDCALVALVDHHPGRADALALEFGGRSLDEIEALGDEVDAAIVCVPTSAHLLVAAPLLELGLDLFVEKPLAEDVEAGRRLADLAREEARILQVGHVEWYNPAWRRALAAAAETDSIEVERMQPRSPRGLDLDVVQDLMIHDLDWVTRWLAEEGDELVDLEATGRCVVNDKLDEAHARLRFRSGRVVDLRASRVHAERRRCLRIESSRGVTTADLLLSNATTPDALGVQWAQFLDCVRSRKRPDTDAEDGVRALQLVERVRAAIGAARGSR